jgi:hypothetical protein
MLELARRPAVDGHVADGLPQVMSTQRRVQTENVIEVQEQKRSVHAIANGVAGR